jgi:hypothetical protein
MAQEPTPDKCVELPKVGTGHDPLENLVVSLIELKSNIARVEEQHPSLGNDLSGLCDLVIDHLKRPEDSQPGAAKQSPATPAPIISKDAFGRPQQRGCASLPQLKQEPLPLPLMLEPPLQIICDPADPLYAAEYTLQLGTETSDTATSANKVDMGSPAFDLAGDRLTNGLYKVGDGIIFVLEKILSIGSRNNNKRSF